MGASGWSYFTPYQMDVEAALQKLRHEIFEKKEFGASRLFTSEQIDTFAEHVDLSNVVKLDFKNLGQQMAELETEQKAAGSIEEALEAAAESGTHSILDIVKISPVPDFAAAWPAPEELVTEVFGTSTPSREDVTRHEMELTELMELERWQAVYVTIYKNGKPSEFYFEGVSGD